MLELHEWHVQKCSEHPLFALVTSSNHNRPKGEAHREGDEPEDVCVSLMQNETEEGKKVARLGGRKHYAVFRRLDESEIQQRRFAGSAMQVESLWTGQGDVPTTTASQITIDSSNNTDSNSS